ncbi:hypothetical protein OG21DRAFT_1481246 [Imleria badia]|nr:hypothetical protein OG21DRAFT_1481246 [Imleria badia]
MDSPATSPVTSPFITSGTTPATSQCQHEHDNTPDRLPSEPTVLTRDFYLDTFFNPVWMSGPNVFSFAEDGTVVRPETYGAEPYPGYHADRTRRVESVDASHFQGFSERTSKPWKSVVITEQDDAEFAEFQARLRVGAVGEWRQHLLYGPAPSLTANKPSSYTPGHPSPTDGKGW